MGKDGQIRNRDAREHKTGILYRVLYRVSKFIREYYTFKNDTDDAQRVRPIVQLKQ